MAESIESIQDKRIARKKKERLQKWLLIVIAVFLFFYLGFSVLAPVLMKNGHIKAANTIYKAYKPACHQLAYRSIFLFGEQAVYPRQLAGIKGIKSYEMVINADPQDTDVAAAFIGNEQLGYKLALCQRDIAIFSSMLLFIMVYLIFGQRFNAIPWWLWVLLAILPIGLDGFWQLFSQMGLRILSWLPARESTPFLRVLTGTLFGLFSAWFIVPTLREDGEGRHSESHSETLEAALIEDNLEGQDNEEN